VAAAEISIGSRWVALAEKSLSVLADILKCPLGTAQAFKVKKMEDL
jgi:hypothetical protein